ncbi:unnamed protein product [Protopolystoma xenopodis]|uniref:Uncharacterized protein n=1 Tax=Protopolystoma xenopodis TaxID=117903 RepID=A0A448XSG0_9PLAT|nr:unnamed protein product [Protopolystoma xenopodis]
MHDGNLMQLGPGHTMHRTPGGGGCPPWGPSDLPHSLYASHLHLHPHSHPQPHHSHPGPHHQSHSPHGHHLLSPMQLPPSGPASSLPLPQISSPPTGLVHQLHPMSPHHQLPPISSQPSGPGFGAPSHLQGHPHQQPSHNLHLGPHSHHLHVNHPHIPMHPHFHAQPPPPPPPPVSHSQMHPAGLPPSMNSGPLSLPPHMLIPNSASLLPCRLLPTPPPGLQMRQSLHLGSGGLYRQCHPQAMLRQTDELSLGQVRISTIVGLIHACYRSGLWEKRSFLGNLIPVRIKFHNAKFRRTKNSGFGSPI